MLSLGGCKGGDDAWWLDKKRATFKSSPFSCMFLNVCYFVIVL